MISTTYIHTKLQYFFTHSQQIDIEIGAALNLPISYCLDVLQQSNITTTHTNSNSKYKLLQCSLALLSHLVQIPKQQPEIQPAQVSDAIPSPPAINQFSLNYKNYAKFYQNDGFRCCVFAVKNYLQYLSNLTSSGTKSSVSIVDEMIIKTLINLIYVAVFGYTTSDNEGNFNGMISSFKQHLIDVQIDSLLIKMVTLTLQVYYLPIKKLVMLYMRVLAIMFHPTQSDNKTKVSNSSLRFYEDSEMLEASMNNLLTQNYLQQFKEKNKPQDVKNKAKSNSIQSFYVKHNVGDCPLAQSIVVGLLRSLLTICNSQMHKKFQLNPSKGSGADSYREWQISYQFIIQISSSSKQEKEYKKYLSVRTLKLLKDYSQYNEGSETNDKNLSSTLVSYPTHYQFYRHKIYTTSAISTFFTFLLVNFKRNALIQFTYLYQLISDANGILVFLKFLTDKFQNLQALQIANFKEQKSQADNFLTFKSQVMLTVYSVLLVLYGACNNYTEKTRNFLFQYNSYLIIKKIPHIFMKAHKNDDQLPSQQQIQAQFGNKDLKKRTQQQSENFESDLNDKVKQLTELCYLLLKIQIPFFSKKMKQNSNNMKMIVDIYCQMPKKAQPINRTQLDKLILKNEMKKDQHEKFILSVQQLKSVHNQYNNLYYWSNQEAKINEEGEKKQEIIEEPLKMTRQEMEKWLEQNVWKFYD